MQEITWLQSLALLLFAAAGYALCFRVARRRDEQLRATRARYESIVAAAMDAILTVDAQRRIVVFNRAAERTFACNAADAIGTPVERFIPENSGLISVAAHRVGNVSRIDALRADGTRFPAEASVSHVEIAGEHLYTVVLRDSSDRVRAEREIAELTHNLERRVEERTQALSESVRELEAFSYTVSHDLRAPLRGIHGFAAMLEADAGQRLEADERELLARISGNAQQMAALIDGLLEFSRLGRQAPAQREVDMDALVRRVLRSAGEAYPGLEAAVQLDPLGRAWGDELLLERVWFNLLDNARKFSARAAPPRIQVGRRDEEGRAVYFVRDNGAGFDPRYGDKLFRVFERLHGVDEFPGTGVGLAIVRRIVERHGGRTWAHSLPGEGATFYFALPLSSLAAAGR